MISTQFNMTSNILESIRLPARSKPGTEPQSSLYRAGGGITGQGKHLGNGS